MTIKCKKNGLFEVGSLVSEYDTMLSGIQIRRPDIVYLTNEQIQLTKKNQDVIPDFVIIIISETDLFYQIEINLQNILRRVRATFR